MGLPLALAQGEPLREAWEDFDALWQPLPLPLADGGVEGVWLWLVRGVTDAQPEGELVLVGAALPLAQPEGDGDIKFVPLTLALAVAERVAAKLLLALEEGGPLRVAFEDQDALGQPLPLPLAEGDFEGEWLPLVRGVADAQPEAVPDLEGAPLPLAVAQAERERVAQPLALAQGVPLRLPVGEPDALGQPLPLPLTEGCAVDDEDLHAVAEGSAQAEGDVDIGGGPLALVEALAERLCVAQALPLAHAVPLRLPWGDPLTLALREVLRDSDDSAVGEELLENMAVAEEHAVGDGLRVGTPDALLHTEALVLPVEVTRADDVGLSVPLPESVCVYVSEPVPVGDGVGDTVGDCELDVPSVGVGEAVGDGVSEGERVGLAVPLPVAEPVTVAVTDAAATQPPPSHKRPSAHTGRDATRVQCAPAALALA